jgi:hypothetical protein
LASLEVQFWTLSVKARLVTKIFPITVKNIGLELFLHGATNPVSYAELKVKSGTFFQINLLPFPSFGREQVGSLIYSVLFVVGSLDQSN